MVTKKTIRKSNKNRVEIAAVPLWWFDDVEAKVYRMARLTLQHDLAYELLLSTRYMDEQRALAILQKNFGPISFEDLYFILAETYSGLTPPT